MPICSQCFHQATNVHGLRTAADGAMVVDESQSSSPRIVSESAAAAASPQRRDTRRCTGRGRTIILVTS